VYITPTQPIDEGASNINGLLLIQGKLKLHGKPVESLRLLDAMVAFYKFLCLFERKCILVAHNCRFDRLKLMLAIKKTFMDKYFQSVILGFADTLPLIKEVNKKKGKGENSLETIATNLKLDVSQAHDALQDVILLENITQNLKINDEKIFGSIITWADS